MKRFVSLFSNKVLDGYVMCANHKQTKNHNQSHWISQREDEARWLLMSGTVCNLYSCVVFQSELHLTANKERVSKKKGEKDLT